MCEPSTGGGTEGTEQQHVQKVKYSMQIHRCVSHLQEQKEQNNNSHLQQILRVQERY